MKPDITNLPRDQGWLKVQDWLGAEQRELPPGHGIWYSMVRYPELKRTMHSTPIFKMLYAASGWRTPAAPKFTGDAMFRVTNNVTRGCIQSIRVTGPLMHHPRYIGYVESGLIDDPDF